jgi:4a-hydroxytetrahydrobiopterin dehydratase
MKLAQKQCVPCRGRLPRLDHAKARELLTQLSGWKISKDRKWLNKSYKFKNFAEALTFVNKVGKIAEKEGHHPDIRFGWGYVGIGLQTHAIGGLHENDFILAAKIDSL